MVAVVADEDVMYLSATWWWCCLSVCLSHQLNSIGFTICIQLRAELVVCCLCVCDTGPKVFFACRNVSHMMLVVPLTEFAAENSGWLQLCNTHTGNIAIMQLSSGYPPPAPGPWKYWKVLEFTSCKFVLENEGGPWKSLNMICWFLENLDWIMEAAGLGQLTDKKCCQYVSHLVWRQPQKVETHGGWTERDAFITDMNSLLSNWLNMWMGDKNGMKKDTERCFSTVIDDLWLTAWPSALNRVTWPCR